MIFRSLVVGAMLAASAAAAELPHHPPVTPNVLMITLESVRADAIGDATPVLKSLAARGIVFTSCTATADTPSISAFSLLTGYAADAVGSTADTAAVSLPAQLGARGFRTFAVVASLDLQPTAVRAMAAFQEQVNLPATWLAMPSSERSAFRPAIDARLSQYGVEPTEFNRMTQFAAADEVLRRAGPLLAGSRPFFGLIDLADAQDPWTPDPASYDRRGEAVSVPSMRERRPPEFLANPESIRDPAFRFLVETTLGRSLARPWATTLDLTPEELAVYRTRYRAEVRDVDRAVGSLLERLERSGLLESTIVVIVSTTGEEFGETGLLTHGFNFRGDRAATRRVMLTLLLPPSFKAEPRVVSTPVSIADVAPTLYGLLGIRSSELWSLQRGRHGASRLRELGVIARRRSERVSIPPAQPAFELPDDREIRIASAAEALARRQTIIRFLWNQDQLPDVRPSSVTRGVRNPIGGLTEASRVDDLRITVRGMRDLGQAYHFQPRVRNGELVIVHAGHGCQPLDDGLQYENAGGGMARTIAALLAEGYGVAAVRMPRQRPDDCGEVPAHEPLFAGSAADGMASFLEPVLAVVNSLTTGNAPYTRVHMLGLSGGGWTTTLYAALDPRILTSLSVAGSLPLYLRESSSVGDIEQRVPEFYRLAGYPELYVLAAADPGRKHLQVLIANDNCCFAWYDFAEPAAFRPEVAAYADRVRRTLETIGGGTFDVRFDEATPQHTISRKMLTDLIVPSLRGE